MQHAGQFRGAHRLKDVFGRADLNGLLRVFKIVKARKEHQLDAREAFSQMTPERQTVHKRHLDIGHDNVGMQRFGKLQSFLAVFGRADKGKAAAGPVDFTLNAVADFRFVVDKHNAVQKDPSLYTESI